MSKITKEEIRNLVAKEIKEKGLNEVISSSTLDEIRDKIVSRMQKDKATSEIPDFVSELDIPSSPGGAREFPDSNELTVSPANDTGMNKKDNVNIPAGSEPTETPYEPTGGYTPELPNFLDKVEPGKVIVFDYNELSEGGENLTKKPFRQYDNPDMKKSIHDLWMEEGKRRTEVYQAKFEKIGEMEFDYANGTTKFIEKSAPQDYQGEHGGFKVNPYVADPQPVLDEPNKMELEKYIQNSIDLEKVVYDIVMDIVKGQLLNNSEKSVNQENYFKSNDFNMGDKAAPYNQQHPEDRHIANQQHTNRVKQMEEGEADKNTDVGEDDFVHAEEPVDEVVMKQLYSEESNVVLHEEAYSLITMRRNFQANRQLFIIQNDALTKTLQELGRA
jgi:hypothetical protein